VQVALMIGAIGNPPLLRPLASDGSRLQQISSFRDAAARWFAAPPAELVAIGAWAAW
jgi:hypothetical protein